MTTMEPWRNSTPFFGAAALCTIKIEPELLTTWSCSKPPSNQLSDQRNLTKFEQNDNKINSSERIREEYRLKEIQYNETPPPFREIVILIT